MSAMVNLSQSRTLKILIIRNNKCWRSESLHWLMAISAQLQEYFLTSPLALPGSSEVCVSTCWQQSDEKAILVSENDLFLTLGSDTSSARNENLRPFFYRNIPLINGKYGLRNHFWPLESCFLMSKSEKKGPNFLCPLLPISRLTFLESSCNFRQLAETEFFGVFFLQLYGS